MNINDLPDDCLFSIFNELTDLRDLVFSYSVCTKWNQVVKKRCRRVRFAFSEVYLDNLLEPLQPYSISIYGIPDYYDVKDAYIYNKDPNYPKLSINCLGSHLFPNLQIIQLSVYAFDDEGWWPSETFWKRLKRLIKKSNTIKGLVDTDKWTKERQVLSNCGNLEIISCYMLPARYFTYTNGPKIKQLDIECCESLLEKSRFFPNLEILSTRAPNPIYCKYKKATFPNLEIFILGDVFTQKGNLQIGIDLIDRCPKLKSCYFSVGQPSYEETFSFEKTLHNQLEDMVLQFNIFTNLREIDWNFNTIEEVLRKFPNLKNLALRNLLYINDQHVERIVNMLPNLITLDLKYSRYVTKSSEVFIDHLNRKNGRSINFQYGGIKTFDDDDNVDLECLGRSRDRILIDIKSNFMENYFYKDRSQLPSLLGTIN